MKNIIIAAGYATRLYPLTENFPKPLLKVGSKSILERMFDDIDNIDDIDEHIIVTNHKFAHCFEEWKKEMNYKKPIRIVDDGTESNETRLGAVRDLLLAIDSFHVDDDMMVLAADNILDFSFQGFVDFFKKKGSSVIMCHHEPELKKLQRTGVIAVDDSWRAGDAGEAAGAGVALGGTSVLYLQKERPAADQGLHEPRLWLRCTRKPGALPRGQDDGACLADAGQPLRHRIDG